MKNIICIISAAVCIGTAGCSEPSSPDEYSNQVVLNAYLFAGRSIDSVFVQRTARILEYYSDAAIALTGASVKINLMKRADPAAIETTFVLSDDPAKPGRYFSPATILPLRTYTIAVQANGYSTVTGTTTVPDTFRMLMPPPPVIAWNIDLPAITIAWSPSNHYADFVVSITSVDSNAKLIADFRTTKRLPEDPMPEKSSFMFNIPDASFREIPWLMFSYLGRHSISVSAVDENYYNFLRQIIAGGSSMREIRYNLRGGIGVFASASTAFSPVLFSLTQ